MILLLPAWSIVCCSAAQAGWSASCRSRIHNYTRVWQFDVVTIFRYPALLVDTIRCGRECRDTMTQQASGEQPASNDYLIAELRDEIVRTGRIPFARFMDLALYHPVHGYYMSPDRRPGRGGDFLTAPELHPFFGLTVARQIAECRDDLDRPEPFTIL